MTAISNNLFLQIFITDYLESQISKFEVRLFRRNKSFFEVGYDPITATMAKASTLSMAVIYVEFRANKRDKYFNMYQNWHEVIAPLKALNSHRYGKRTALLQ